MLSEDRCILFSSLSVSHDAFLNGSKQLMLLNQPIYPTILCGRTREGRHDANY